MAAIVLEGLVKAYGGAPVVRGLSLEVGPSPGCCRESTR